MSVKVVYHAGCWDGFCAAWLMRMIHPDAEFIPAYHGNDPPEVDSNTILYVVDFSYPREVLLDLADRAGLVHVEDHHKTAQEDLDGLKHERLEINFDMEKSGARMVWDYTSGYSEASHWLVDYTEDRDLWKNMLPQTKEINAALRSYPLNFKVWDDISQRDPQGFASEGEAILRYKQKLVEQHLQFARKVTFNTSLTDEYPSGAGVNCSAGDLQSEVAGALAEEHGIGACWVDQGDGEQLWSLRSRSDVDVSIIAKAYGGGGHKNAAGFRCSSGTIEVGDRIERQENAN